MKSVLVRMVSVLLLAALSSGCALIMPKDDAVSRRFFWPSEPDEPKIEWIATYLGDLDIKEKNWFSKIVGDDAVIQFGRPVSVAGDGEGRIVISDQEKGQVYLFDLNTREAVIYGGNDGAASFNSPSGVAVDADGNFYVADTDSKKIYVTDNKNKVVRVINIADKVKSIGGIAIDRVRKKLLVPDARGNQVLFLSLEGEQLGILKGKGYFAYPNAVAVMSDGGIVVVDTFNAALIRFSPEGKYVLSIGKRGDSPGDLSTVSSVAVDSEDHIYATDTRLHNVTIFDKNGATLLAVGGLHSIRTGNIGRGGFLVPLGISIDKNDRIYVADSLNKRVQLFQFLTERYLKENPVKVK